MQNVYRPHPSDIVEVTTVTVLFSQAFQKIRRAEKEIAKLDQKLVPAAVDREHITDEEKHMFVKLGRRMHAFLLMGKFSFCVMLILLCPVNAFTRRMSSGKDCK